TLPSDSGQFTYVPVVTAVSPTSGPENGGTKVSITGAGFAQGVGETTVVFGRNAAASVTCSGATSCMAVSPGGSGTVDLRVTGGGQISAIGPSNRFTYTAANRTGWLQWHSGSGPSSELLHFALATYDSARAGVLLFAGS